MVPTPMKTRPRAGLISLLVIATAQLMIVLDDSIVNIALPSIQDQLRVDPVHLPWIVNGYILSFGALLLLGGRMGDLWGRKRTLQIGLLVFVLGSLAGGLGQSAEMLIAARALQGIGAAMTAPNVLALIATTFEDRKTRDTALSLYGAMSGIGIVIGLVLGGFLTDALSWRWVFFINIPIGLLVLLGSRTLVAPQRNTGRLGLLDGILGTAGMISLVYAITRFGEDGLIDPVAYALVLGAAVLLAAFVLIQRRSPSPLVPLSLFRDRNRAGAYLTMLGLAIGPMGILYVVTLYLQQIQQYSPLVTGLSMLPFAAGIILGAGSAPKVLLKVAPRWVTGVGGFLSTAGALWIAWVISGEGGWLPIAPGFLVVALGFGLGVMALTQAAVYRVEPDKAGIASALLNSAQQIGVALGLAVLAGVAATVTAGSGGTTQALVGGYSTALVVGAGILLAAAVLALLTLSGRVNAEEHTIDELGITRA
ncbi:MFS transporter [Arthrobacter sp. B0490]|uniref:MFS transporter n=1 Tax=Arthrobacter sp. B0490 TaxID=2058891 RepID=UPI001CA558DD|nr:MFS transporter [Arthrobacter sp. B0490]